MTEPSAVASPNSPQEVPERTAPPIITPEERRSLQHHAFTMAHTLLRPGARVVVPGCGYGGSCFHYARLKPRHRIIGIDINPAHIEAAKASYKRENLDFIVGDVEALRLPYEADGIINAFSLHRIYSRTGYNAERVLQVLQTHVTALRNGGVLLIRDYASPQNPEKFVLLELPDTPSSGKTPLEMGEADLLLEFSETARPLDSFGCQGFFVEEIPAFHEGTRLFRLPHKWAVEFLIRMDNRTTWDKDLLQDYTSFSATDLKKELSSMDMRVLYSAPHWDPQIVEGQWQERVRLYSEDGTPIEYPPTSQIILAQKVTSRESVLIQERRQSQSSLDDLEITPYLNRESGEIFDIVRRRYGVVDDVLAYRITPEGWVNVYVQTGVPRPTVNVVPRGSPNLDGKEWSGHMMDPLNLPPLESLKNPEPLFSMLSEVTGLSQAYFGKPELGMIYMPAADLIDEQRRSYFVEVKKPRNRKHHRSRESRMLNPGRIYELDIQDLLLACQVGMVGESRLELNLLTLMQRLGVKPVTIGGIKPEVGEADPQSILDIDKLLEDSTTNETVFSVSDKMSGALSHVRSVFVEEGRIGGLPTGLGSDEMEFIRPNKTSVNTAIVLLLGKVKDKLVVGVERRKMPVPKRYGGYEDIVTAPTFRLPEEINSISAAKRFVAEKLGVDVKYVHLMGGSFFVDTNVTPERVFPFVVYKPGKLEKWPVRYALECGGWIWLQTRPLWWKSLHGTFWKAMKDLGRYWYGGEEQNYFPEPSRSLRDAQLNALTPEAALRQPFSENYADADVGPDDFDDYAPEFSIHNDSEPEPS